MPKLELDRAHLAEKYEDDGYIDINKYDDEDEWAVILEALRALSAPPA